MQFNRALEPLPHEVDFGLWRRNAAFRLLLKGMKHVHSAGQPYGIHGAKCVTAVIGNNLQEAGTDVPQWFCLYVFAAQLRLIERDANFVLDRFGKVPHRGERIAHPDQRLWSGFGRHVHSLSGYAIFSILTSKK